MKRLFLVLLFLPLISFSQFKTDWITSITSYDSTSGSADEIRRIKIDNNNFIIVSGITEGFGIVKYSNGNKDSLAQSTQSGRISYLIKLDSSGNKVWQYNFSSNANTMDNSISLDSNNNIYFSVSYEDTLLINKHNNSSSITTTYFNASHHGGSLLIKISPFGVINWIKSLPVWIHDIEVTDHINLIGRFRDSVNFDLKGGVANMFGTNERGIFICKYDFQLNLLWRNQIGGTYSQIAVDDSSNVFFYGGVGWLGDFQPGPGNTWISGDNIFFGKINANGSFGWAKAISSASRDHGLSILILGQYIYITAEYGASFNIGSQNQMLPSYGSMRNCFIAKCNKRGQIEWINTIHSSGAIRNNALEYKNGLLYTGGFMSDSLILYNQNNTKRTYRKGTNPFLVVYDTTGNFNSHFHFGDSSNYGDGYRELAIDYNNNIYAVGFYSEKENFSPYSITPFFSTSHGRYDGFVHRLSSFTVGNLQAEKNKNKFTLYPNPSNGNLKLNLERALSGTLKIVNIKGQLVYERELNKEQNLTLNLNLENGIYFVRLSNQMESYSEKLLIH